MDVTHFLHCLPLRILFACVQVYLVGFLSTGNHITHWWAVSQSLASHPLRPHPPLPPAIPGGNRSTVWRDVSAAAALSKRAGPHWTGLPPPHPRDPPPGAVASAPPGPTLLPDVNPATATPLLPPPRFRPTAVQNAEPEPPLQPQPAAAPAAKAVADLAAATNGQRPAVAVSPAAPTQALAAGDGSPLLTMGPRLPPTPA
eukprot:EG_transcript_32077